MTPISLIYFLLGLSSLYWPFVTLLFKRRVLGAQWLIMAALLAMSLSVIIYSTFFNTFLKGEFLLVIIFMVLSMFTSLRIKTRKVRAPFVNSGLLLRDSNIAPYSAFIWGVIRKQTSNG